MKLNRVVIKKINEILRLFFFFFFQKFIRRQLKIPQAAPQIVLAPFGFLNLNPDSMD